MGDRSRKVALLLVSLAVSFVAAEVMLRLFKPVEYRQPLRPESGDVWSQSVHRPSSTPGLAYELAPGVEKISDGVTVRTNSHGMRDSEPLPQTGKTLLRIAVLGDSFTFGFGVSEGDAYPAVLERMLRESVHGEVFDFDVMNFGVGGYCSRDQVVVLKHKVLQWHPDVVIVGYVLNDPEIDPVQPLHRYYHAPRWWQHSNILRLIAKAGYAGQVKRLGGGSYIQYLHRHPEKWQSVVTAFEDIGEAAKSEGFRVITMIFPMIPNRDDWMGYPFEGIHTQVARLAETNGFTIVDLYDVYSRQPPSHLRLSDMDRHPNESGHRMAAEALAISILGDSLLFDPDG